jgi:hypothetical protein
MAGAIWLTSYGPAAAKPVRPVTERPMTFAWRQIDQALGADGRDVCRHGLGFEHCHTLHRYLRLSLAAIWGAVAGLGYSFGPSKTDSLPAADNGIFADTKPVPHFRACRTRHFGMHGA